jgi:pimeloyl-ACP methyl ester carboxylesterase
MITTPSFMLATIERGNPNAKKLALLLPGRLDTKDYVHMREHASFLAERGYYAVSFDPPGTWKSPGGTADYTLTNYLKAINELIDHFGKRPTLLMGHSRGGSMAMLAGVTNPHVTAFAAVLSRAVPSSVGLDEAKTKGVIVEYRDLPPGNVRTKEKRRYVLPYHFFEDAAQYSSLEALKTCIKPKLRFYGKRDALVSVEAVKQEHELSAEPKMLYELDCEHDYRLDSSIITEVNRVLGSFLHTYNL